MHWRRLKKWLWLLYTCGSMLKYSFPVIVTNTSVRVQLIRVSVCLRCMLNKKDVCAERCCSQTAVFKCKWKRRRREEREFRINFLLNNLLKHPQNPLISGQHSGEEAKALRAIYPLSYPSFIPSMLIMSLRLVLDVLTKLFIWLKGRLQTPVGQNYCGKKWKENFQCGCLEDERGDNSKRNFNNI